MLKPPMDLAAFEKKAGEVAQILKVIGNDRRLMVLCKLVEHGERTVGDLAGDVGLSHSALSHHLPQLSADGLFAFRGQRQPLWFRIARPRAKQTTATCEEER